MAQATSRQYRHARTRPNPATRALSTPAITSNTPKQPEMSVTFKAVPGQLVTTKGFRIRHANVRIEGFDITKYDVGLDQGHIRVEPEGDNCQIVNNTIRDGIYLTSAGFLFDGPTRTITNPTGGFIAAGFVPGVSIYITSDINTQIRNHDNNKSAMPSFSYETKIVKAVTDTTLTLNDSNTMFSEGPVPSTIYVNSAEKNGMWGILFISQHAAWRARQLPHSGQPLLQSRRQSHRHLAAIIPALKAIRLSG